MRFVTARNRHQPAMWSGIGTDRHYFYPLWHPVEHGSIGSINALANLLHRYKYCSSRWSTMWLFFDAFHFFYLDLKWKIVFSNFYGIFGSEHWKQYFTYSQFSKYGPQIQYLAHPNLTKIFKNVIIQFQLIISWKKLPCSFLRKSGLFLRIIQLSITEVHTSIIYED